jgi:YD repeat-containing protein
LGAVEGGRESCVGKSARCGTLTAFVGIVACAAALVASPQLHAGQERYDYDPLGRVIRVIDEQGRVTEYVYDAAGNITQIVTGGVAVAPTIATMDTQSIRRGESKPVTITGNGLTAVSISTSDPGLDVSGISFGATSLRFVLTAAATATLGAQSITLRNAAGSVSAALTVNPALPTLGMTPQPIAVPPDNAPRNFFVTLSNADNVDYVVSLSSTTPSVAAVSPASITIPAGQTQVLVTVTGKGIGTTSVALAAPGLASTSFPVFVTADFAGARTSFAQALGVVLQATGGTPTPRLTASKPVGIVKGAYIDSVAPGALVIGTGPTTLVVNGVALDGVTGVSIVPPDGLTVGAPTVAPDGRSVRVPVTVAANAPTTVRKVLLAGPQQPYIAARPGADQFQIALPAAQIFSLSPFFAPVGTTAMTLTIRGQNLQGTQKVTFTPSAGIEVDALPAASADGSTVTLNISIAQNAATSNRVVQVVTPGGISDATPTAANTFQVVNQVGSVFTPINAAPVGVVLQDVAAPPPSFSSYSNLIGVAVGSVVTGVTPATATIGQTTPVTIQGNELQGVNSVQVSPPDGVTVSAPVPAVDGKSVTVSVTVTSDAPQTLRGLRVLAGSVSVPFSNPGASQFRVTPPAAALDSITPNFLQTGAAPVTLTIRGSNFQNASAIGVVPPDGISVNNPPTLDVTGAQLTVSISAAATAATGPRAVTVTTPAGTSPSALSAANTLQISSNVGATVSPVSAFPLGVVLQSNTPPPPMVFGPFSSPSVGVVLQDPNPPAAPQTLSTATNVGVAVGAVATGVAVPPLVAGSSATLTVSGFALNDVTALSIVPSTGVTLGALSVSPDGSQVSIPLTVQAGAAAGLRGVSLLRGTTPVQFMPPGANTFSIGVGVPNMASISPILASRGQVITMTVRGQNFQGATVSATPGTGLSIDAAPVVSADGTTITLQIAIDANAPLGANVIRVTTPGGTTTDVAGPANTFTVQP